MKNIKITLALLLTSAVIIASMNWHVDELRNSLIHSSSINTARLYTTALNQFRSLYTSEVVHTARKSKLDVSHDYAARDNAIPLPATLSMLLGEKIGLLTAGAKSQLLSPYPFPWRKQGKDFVLGDFDQKAWDSLNENPSEPYYEFSLNGDEATLYYATADIMEAECVSCHNSYPRSPKTDWKVGDVRGILKVSLPLDSIFLETSSNLLKTMHIYITVGLGLVILVGFAIIKLSRYSEELEQKVTERTKELKSEMLERIKLEERFHTGIEASPAAMIMTNEKGNIVYTNNEANRVFGYPPEELTDRPVEILVPNKYKEYHLSCREDFLQSPSVRSMGGRELYARKMNGDTFPVQIGITPIETTDGMLILCAVTDLTERKKIEDKLLEKTKLLKTANERLHIEATVDTLTNIGNRRSLFTQLDIILKLSQRNCRPLSVLMADIDGFKEYNDKFGHPAGDSALKEVAQTIKDVNRDADYVARYGGEEFVILLPDTDDKGALLAAEKIRIAVESISVLERKVTVSVGAATLTSNKHESFKVQHMTELLIKQADEALYHSKRNGRNIVKHANMMSNV